MSKIDKRFCKLTNEEFIAQRDGDGFEKYSIVFISDRKVIWHDGIEYGISDEQAEAILKYQSALPDELTTPSKHGGLAAGVKVSELKKKTLSQLFDDILFEEIQPTVKNPSCSISPKGSWANNGIYEVGAAAPSDADTDFNISFDRGACTVVGQPTKYRAGTETSRDVKLGTSALQAGSKITLGTMTYNLTVNHGQGDILLTSKGNKATNVNPNPLAAGSVKSSCNIYGTYPFFCNGQTASSSNQDSNLPSTVTPNTKLPLIKWTDALIGAKFASEATTGTRLEFIFPKAKNVTKVEFFNTVSGKWEVFGSDKYSVAPTAQQTVQGTPVDYNKLTTTGSMSGALQLRFTLANAAGGQSLDETSTYEGEEITDEVFRALAMKSTTVPFMPINDVPVLMAASTGNRPSGVAAFAVNFEPGGQSPLDARSLVPAKADLIAAATYSGKNIYKGMLVVVADDGGKPALYILKDVAKITSADYSGWQRVDVGGQTVVQIVNDLTTGGTDKALSAEQGKALKGLIDAINGKLTGVDTNVGTLIDEKVKTAKDAIDAYTVNGKKINTNPVLAKGDVGLGNVTNDAQVKRSEMGVANGVATLGEDGKVPSAQLPSYVDDVIEIQKVVAAKSNIPTSGLTTGQIFYATAEKKLFTATNETTVDAGATPEAGKIYIAVADGNKQYRWGGDVAGLVQITSGNLVIGEATGTAYDGLKGKQNRDAITSLPATITSEVKDVTQAADKVTIGVKVATKSGLNYGSPAAANIDIPAAATGKAGVMTGAQVDALTKATNDITGLGNKTVNGHKISENPVLNGADVALTGFTELPEETVNEALKPVATDTVNQAVAKLLKAILDNEEVVSASFAKLIESVGLDEHLGYTKKPDGYTASDIAGVLAEAAAKIKTLEQTKSDYEAFKAQFDWYEGE